MSRREEQIAGLVAEGHSNKEIAGRLGLTEGTVKVYLSRLFRKIGCVSRVALSLRMRQLARDPNDSLDTHRLGLGRAEGAD